MATMFLFKHHIIVVNIPSFFFFLFFSESDEQVSNRCFIFYELLFCNGEERVNLFMASGSSLPFSSKLPKRIRDRP